ncbi:hypothetical protein [Aureimonas phyllosphaerae]|uniref:Ca2+-binding RTX toxin-like protein n=1 Tax=Aureimonas phyllosphaerae TaxID=1166078 RepID=A0A7W6FWK2_9HYPH|nr:hypothetical protein [Aureimonas phyllosphaerae]MBB3938010.1 Ca2+-binding RTX toxin-like protein [Aureimonas phyllosphaerae]MBB3962017.1 Ca2+-binding RTX toxin-like protein [Aureimonas phyllosphaerae]SFF53924.1 serralysin [Aureimonas phyllosphaerae]
MTVDLRQQEAVENLRLYGSGGAIDGTDNDLANLITDNAARNVIVGGLGKDSLYGKCNADTFVSAEAGTANKDRIWDFDINDRSQLDKTVFIGLEADNDGRVDVLTAGFLAEYAKAKLIYDDRTGNLSYDVDGAGGEAT